MAIHEAILLLADDMVPCQVTETNPFDLKVIENLVGEEGRIQRLFHTLENGNAKNNKLNPHFLCYH